MSKLMLREVAQSQLSQIPIVDGQLVCCLDTGRLYRDTGSTRLELGAGIESVAALPLAPIVNKLYLIKPNQLYVYDQEWIRLNFSEDSINNKVDKVNGKGLSSNDFSDALLEKLNGISPGANAYVHPKYATHGNGLYKVSVDEYGHVSGATTIVKADITTLGIPAQDTTYADATSSLHGLMTAADKAKLNGVASGAQVNSITGVKGNAESTYRTGNVNITAANIGLGNVNNTADSVKNVASAGKLTGARTITLNGGATGSTSFDGSKDVTISVASLDASKLTGIVGIEHLPAGALERCVVVKDDTARYALSSENVQSGDTVKVDSTGLMYYVVDDTMLNTDAGYEAYTAGSATSVPWSGVIGKPSLFMPSTHTHTISQIADIAAASVASARNATNAINATNSTNAANDAKGQSIANTYIKDLSASGRTVTYTRGDGTTGTFITQDNNTTYSTMSGATSSTAGKEGLVPAPTAGTATRYLRSDGTWSVPPDTDTKYTLNSFGVTATADELNYTDGVTSNIQTQLNEKSSIGHTHNYASSSSSGGPANSAVKLVTPRAINGVNFDGTMGITVTADPKTTSLSYTDLDTLKSNAFYYAPGSNTCVNKPSGVDAFGLHVYQIAAGYIQQDLVAHSGNRYIRKFDGTGWSNWGKIYTSLDPQTSVTGNAGTAAALTTSAGSSTQPIYFKDGKPEATTYTLGKSVPSNAVFTDTNTWRGIQNVLTSTSTSDSLSAAQGKVLKDLVDAKAGTNVATSSTNGLMSNVDKSKLDGVENGANKYVHPVYTEKSSGLYKITVDGNGHVNSTIAAAKADITALGIPAQDTTYSIMTGATASVVGKSGLVPAPATGTSNRYLRSDGTWSIPPDTNTTYSTMIGATDSSAGASGLVPTPATGAATRYLRSDGTWSVPPDTNTTYADATTSVHGLMTAAMVSKLNGIASGANAYVHPNYTTRENGLYKITVDSAGHVNSVTTVVKGDITALGIPSTNTTYGTATSSTNGLMSSGDKAKLDGFGSASTYALKSDIATVYRYKGTVAGYNNLPTTGNSIGDVYDVANGMNYGWTGTVWDALGQQFTISETTADEMTEIIAALTT